MKFNLKFTLILFIGSLTLNMNAQNSVLAKWTAKLTPSQAFIENKGQFKTGANTPLKSEKVEFAVDHGSTMIYFTAKGINYTFLKTYKKEEEEQEREEKEEREKHKNKQWTIEEWMEKEKEERKLNFKVDEVAMLWENSNPAVEIVAGESKSDYHSYTYKNENGVKVNTNYIKGYKKITYKNLYPNIDVEYTFHPEGGIKYAIILRPGADASVVKMNYSKGLSIKEQENLHISTKFGDIIDHAPLTFYANDHKKIVSSKFVKKGKTASFELGDYDKTQTVIIDPWQLTPAFNTNWDCVWECEKDGAGNVYTIGGVAPMVLQKYNAAGTLQWSYNTPYDTTSWLGTFATDLAGNSYVTQGSTAEILKVNNAGTLQWSNTNPGGSCSELWNIAFNCDQTSLIVAGTTTALRGAIFSININSGAVTNTKVVGYGSAFGFPPSIQEVRAITPAKNGKYYFLTLDTIGYINQNFSLCSSGTTLYKTNSTYALSYKCENFRYNNTGIMAIRANGNFVYTQNGVNVHKRSLATGAILATAAIPGGASSTSLGQNQVGNSGIDIDDCGNVYVGSSTGVIKYDANLTLLSQIATPYKVFDVNVSTGGDVIICGATGNQSTNARTGYIQSINMSACAPMTQVCCDATICSAGPFCTSAPAVTLQGATPGGVWSGQGITNSSTGVFNPATAGVGSHTIKYTLPCGADSIVIVVSACGTISVCVNSGSLTASGGGGSYTWASTTTSVNCSGCFGGVCSPFCAGVTVPTWTASGVTVTAPASTVFPITVKDVTTGTTFTFSSLASIPPCTTTSCPTLTLAVTSQTNVNCFGASTGTATVNGSGGVGPYTYTWTPGNLNGASQSALAAGTYTINFKDANQCPGSGTLTITQPTAALGAVISATTATGCGSSTGGATVTASGGTPSYTYSWTPSGGTTAGVSNLAAGNNTVTVTDSKGCIKTAVANITTAGGPTLSVASQTNVNCFGANTGTATVSAAGGTGPYSYTWTPGNLSGASQTTLGAGTYTINVSDAGSCTGSTTLTITQPTAALSAVISATTTTGCGASTGGATVTASGGTPSYTYSWTPSGGTTAGVSNLGIGSNTVLVTDNKNCTVTAIANITTAGGPTPSVVSQTNVNCFGANTGTATISASGGTGPFSYTWSPGNLNGTTQTSLSAGIYTINVTDANLCAGSGTLSITQPTAALSGVISNTIAGSCGSNNGSATVTASGGTPSYTYNWSPNGGSTPSVSNLSSGTNSVTITDGKGCSTTVTLSLNSIGGPTLSVSSQTNVNCFGATTGTATVNASGGTGPYSYTWTPGSLVGASQTSLGAGVYTITIKDNNLCTGSGTIAITQPTSAVSAALANTPTGCGGSSGSATVTASGGTPSYTYSWNPGGSSGTSISGLAAGNYTVTVTDSKGCATTSVTTISSSGGGAALSITSQSNVACFGTATGAATVNALGSSGPYTYTWSPSGGNSPSASGLPAGTYTVFVKDGSCISTITLSILQPPPITLTVSSTPENCGDYDGSATVAASGGNGVLTPLWSNGVTSTLNDLIPGGIYTVTVTDANGCAATATTVVYVVGGLFVDAGSGTTIHAGETALLNGVVPPGATSVWTPSVSLSCPSCPVTDASPAITTTYTLTATLNGCTGYDTVTVFVDIICGELFIPTAFSPNNDGQNDVLYVMSNCITDLEFAIFDRWGEKVFETSDPTQGWDGTFNGKKMNPASFAYYLKAKVNGEDVSKKGNISLIR
jgi:gliding motility-associated-like protein